MQAAYRTYRNQIVIGENVNDAFRIWRSMVHASGSSSEIVDLFAQLDAGHPEIAREIFPFAKSDLLARSQTDWMRKYGAENRRMPRFTSVRNPQASSEYTIVQRETLLTLINLFVLHGCRSDALEISNDAKQIWSDQPFLNDLVLALQGVRPVGP